MQNSDQPVGDISERRHGVLDKIPAVVVPTRRRQLTSGEQSWIVRAISWLCSAILEGFALYGQSFHPCLLDVSDDCSAQEEQPRRAAPAPLPPEENPWSLQGTPPREIDICA